jgi:GntR family transcriptional repressor for pyruvate dehydrogenase complex
MGTQMIGVPLSRYAADKIIEYISAKGLCGGDKLPNETVLCEITGVSRGTIREAIKILNTDNVVAIKRGVGTFVSKTPGVSEDPFGFRFIADKQQLALDLIQIREILEPSLASLAALNATPSEVEELSALSQALEKCCNEGSDTVPLDIEFHYHIARMTHNHVIELIFPILGRTIPEITSYTKKALLADSMEDHRRITAAIRARDAEMAASCMQKHLERNKNYVMACIAKGV